MIYLIYSPEYTPLDSGIIRVKIGSSKNPIRRLVSLQIGSPVPLEILRSIDLENYVEIALHQYFKSFRVRGEWFDLPKQDLETFLNLSIDEIKTLSQESLSDLSIRKLAKICLTPYQYKYFCQLLDFYTELESTNEVLVNVGEISKEVWKNSSTIEVIRKLNVIEQRMIDFLLVDFVSNNGSGHSRCIYSIKYGYTGRGKDVVESVYDEMFSHIKEDSDAKTKYIGDILKEISSKLTESQQYKMKYLIQEFPKLLDEGEIVESTVHIKNKIPNISTNKVFRDFSAIANRTNMFTIEKVLVDDRGKIIDDIFGYEEEKIRRGAQEKGKKKNCRYVRIIWKGKRQ